MIRISSRLLLAALVTCKLLGADEGSDLGTLEVRPMDADEPFAGIFSDANLMRFEQDVEGLPASRVLGVKEAMFIPGVQGDPIKAIKFIGGVSSLNDGSGELFLYASKPEESSFSLNRLPLGYVFHGFGIHSVIAPEAIAQINAYLGGFDAAYGNAIGGVIDITPAYPKGSDSGYMHMGIYNASFGLDVGLGEDTALYLGGRRSYFDLLLEAVGKGTGTLSEDTNTTYTQFPNYYDLSMLLGHQYSPGNYLSLEAVGAFDAITINSQENAIKDPEATGEIDAKQGFVSVGVRHQGSYGIYRTNTVAYNLYSTSRVSLFGGYYLDNVFNRTGVNHQSIVDIGRHRIVAGAEADHIALPLDMNISKPPRDDDVDYDFTTAQKYRIDETYRFTTGAVFVEDIYRPDDHWSLRYGVRAGVTDYNRLGLYADPRMGAVYTFSPGATLGLSAGRYTRVPTGYKITRDLGNPDLDYERAWHLLLRGELPFAQGGTLSIEPFYKRYEALAIDDNVTQFESEGEGYAYGFDLSAKYRDDTWYFFGAYTYTRSERQLYGNDDELYRFYGEVPHVAQLIGSWRFAPEWALSLLAKYNSGKPYTPVVGTYIDASDPTKPRVRPLYGEPFSERLDDYFTLNIKIAQQVKIANGDRLEWSFELMNATNHRNISDILYDENYKIRGYVEQLPLLPWLDITYRF